MTKEQPLMVEVERLRIHLARAKATNAATALSLAAADTAWQELHDEMADAEAEIERLRAELAEYRHDSYRCAHMTRVEKAEAAIARVRACCQDGDVQTFEPPGWVGTDDVLRALDGAE